MPFVSRKKPPSDPLNEPAEMPPDSLLVRLPDSRLAVVLDEYARRTRRSRNLAIVVLLEEAMQREGLWPPGSADPDA